MSACCRCSRQYINTPVTTTMPSLVSIVFRRHTATPTTHRHWSSSLADCHYYAIVTCHTAIHTRILAVFFPSSLLTFVFIITPLLRLPLLGLPLATIAHCRHYFTIHTLVNTSSPRHWFTFAWLSDARLFIVAVYCWPRWFTPYYRRLPLSVSWIGHCIATTFGYWFR